MKYHLLILLLITVSLYAYTHSEKKYKNIITNEKESLEDMASDSGYTVYYCWANWCRPCVSSMKSTLAKTKKTTDSLGISIRYSTILYAPTVTESDKALMAGVSKEGIGIYHKLSPNALTQKLGISSDFKHFEGFEKEFSVPRILLVDKQGNLIDNHFLLNYKPEYFIPKMKEQFSLE